MPASALLTAGALALAYGEVVATHGGAQSDVKMLAQGDGGPKQDVAHGEFREAAIRFSCGEARQRTQADPGDPR